MKRRAWLASLAAVLTASVIWADQGVVKTKDGATFDGDLSEDATNIIVNIRGIETVIPKSDVLSVEHSGDYSQAFITRLSQLPPTDVAGRLTLAREAFGKRQYELATRAINSARSIDPNSRDAAELTDLIASQMRMERAKETPVAPTSQPIQPAMAAMMDRRLLTGADVEAIRRRELTSNDTGVRLRFDADVKKRFSDSQNMAFADFNMLTPLDQAMAILNKGDESVRAQLHVLTDPRAILDFRRQVQPLVTQNCATVGCHGTSAGGGFMLFTPTENDLVTYTNFYILQNYSRRNDNASGVFAGRVLKLVDRGHGDRSLLANYGLPPTMGEYDHPEVRGRTIQPIFRNKEDARYVALLDWMNNTLIPFEPDYGIRYTPPLPTSMPKANP